MMIDKYADPADPNIITDSKEHIEIVKLIDQAYSDMKKEKDPWIAKGFAIWWVSSIQA